MLWQELTFCQQVCSQLWSLTSSLTRFYFVFWCCIVGSCCRVSTPKQATVSDTLSKHTHTHTLTKKVANLDMYSILSGEVFFYENSDISDDDGWGSWTTVSTHRSTNTTTHPWWSTSPLCTFLLGSQERYRAWNWTSWNNWSRSAQNLLPPLTKLWKKTGVSGLLGLVAWKTNDD